MFKKQFFARVMIFFISDDKNDRSASQLEQ